MKLIRFLIVVLVFLLAESAASAVNLYSGTIHPHSTFSDGDRTPSMLKTAAAERSLSFMIAEDHDNQIPTKKKLTGAITNDYGFDKYFRDFSSANSPIVRGTNQHLICIAGAEVNAGQAHLLILQKRPMPLDLHPGQSQEEVVSILVQNNVLFGIAHPCNKDYPFDFGAKGAEQARGFEIYNGDYAKTFEAYRKSEAPGKFTFAGTDSHTSIDATDPARWAHITQVWVKGRLTDESLVEALRNGQTAATNNGAYIKKLNLLPQTGVQDVGEVRFDLTVGFGLPILKAKKVKVYRDKVLRPESIASIPIGTREYRYQWKDATVSEGEHEYFIVVDDECLVTSPIKLKVKTTGKSQAYENWYPQPIVSSDTTRDFMMGQGRRIAFLSSRGGIQGIYFAEIVKGKVAEVRKIKDIPEFFGQFQFSPSGKKVLLFDKTKGIFLLTLDPETSEPKELIDLGLQSSDFFPAWIDNLSFFFFNNVGKIYRAEIKQHTTLQGEIKTTVDLFDPHKGKFLTSKKDNQDFWQLCLVDSRSETIKWLTKGDFNSTDPLMAQTSAVSLLGSSGPVIFTSDKTKQWQIYRLEYSGSSVSKIRKVSRGEAEDTNPCWAFNAEQIYFTTGRLGQRRIGLMNADGSERKILELK